MQTHRWEVTRRDGVDADTKTATSKLSRMHEAEVNRGGLGSVVVELATLAGACDA